MLFDPSACYIDCTSYLLHKHCNCTLSGPLKEPYKSGRICNITDIVRCDYGYRWFSTIKCEMVVWLLDNASLSQWQNRRADQLHAWKLPSQSLLEHPQSEYRSCQHAACTDARSERVFYIYGRDNEDFIAIVVIFQSGKTPIYLEAYMKTLDAQVTSVAQRVPLFTLLANVGGQLGEEKTCAWRTTAFNAGLWLGSSLVTVVQLIVYLCNGLFENLTMREQMDKQIKI